MLKKSEKFGTRLTVGTKLKRLARMGLADELLWEEKYPEQEKETRDGRGKFQHTREWIEKASLEQVFDLWCRGRNLIGFAGIMLRATKNFRKVFGAREGI